MPYITRERREDFKEELATLCRQLKLKEASVGDMNYLFTELLQTYRDIHGVSYSTYNNIIGILECCKLELYRREVSDYEDRKIQFNGDVYS